MKPTYAALLCLSVLAWHGCATAINYPDPLGPILVGHGDTRPETRDGLRVVTFNIRFGEEIARAADLLSTDAALRNPDVLLLEELDGPGTQELARRLAMNYLYVPSAIHPRSRRDIGVAILTPWPLHDPHKVPLPGEHVLTHLRRAAAAATVRAPSGPVLVYGVHLETPFGASDETRRAQARAVLEDATSWNGPLIIAGDFNGTAGAAELATLGLTWLTRRLHDTAGPLDLDHIVGRGLCAADGPDTVRGPEVHRISDHRPVWTVLRPCPSGR